LGDNIGRKIINIEEPDDKKWGLYIVTFQPDQGEPYKGHMTLESMNVAKLEIKMAELGYDMKLIDEYKDAILDDRKRDRMMDED